MHVFVAGIMSTVQTMALIFYLSRLIVLYCHCCDFRMLFDTPAVSWCKVFGAWKPLGVLPNKPAVWDGNKLGRIRSICGGASIPLIDGRLLFLHLLLFICPDLFLVFYFSHLTEPFLPPSPFEHPCPASGYVLYLIFYIPLYHLFSIFLLSIFILADETFFLGSLDAPHQVSTSLLALSSVQTVSLSSLACTDQFFFSPSHRQNGYIDHRCVASVGMQRHDQIQI